MKGGKSSPLVICTCWGARFAPEIKEAVVCLWPEGRSIDFRRTLYRRLVIPEQKVWGRKGGLGQTDDEDRTWLGLNKRPVDGTSYRGRSRRLKCWDSNWRRVTANKAGKTLAEELVLDPVSNLCCSSKTCAHKTGWNSVRKSAPILSLRSENNSVIKDTHKASSSKDSGHLEPRLVLSEWRDFLMSELTHKNERIYVYTPTCYAGIMACQSVPSCPVKGGHTFVRFVYLNTRNAAYFSVPMHNHIVWIRYLLH